MVGKKPRQTYWTEIHDAINSVDGRVQSLETSTNNLIDPKSATTTIFEYPVGLTTFKVSETVTTGYPALNGVVETLYHDSMYNIQHFFTSFIPEEMGKTYFRKWNYSAGSWSDWEQIITSEDLLAHENNQDIHITPLDHVRLSGFVYDQVTPESIWTILHNLNKFPSVTTVDSAGEKVMGNVHYDNKNQVTISFSGAFSGQAYLG